MPLLRIGSERRLLPLPAGEAEGVATRGEEIEVATVRGALLYYHYGVDGVDDRVGLFMISKLRVLGLGRPSKGEQSLIVIYRSRLCVQGWGCGYRTLQSLVSWLRLNCGHCADEPGKHGSLLENTAACHRPIPFTVVL